MSNEEKDNSIGKLQSDQNTLNILKGLWSKILENEDVDLDDDFDEIGGTSIKLASLFVEINNHFPNKISLNDLYINRTIRKIFTLIKGRSFEEESKEIEF